MDRSRKVLAYITNKQGENWELLVFKEGNESDFRVPGGTIDQNELIIDALYRKIKEETGLSRDELEFLGKIDKTNHFPEDREKVYERTVFHLAYTGEVKKKWDHQVTGDNTYKNKIFHLQFIPIKKLPDLASNQDQAIPLLI